MNTDPIADLLTRIRNASSVGKREITCPASSVKQEILKVLSAEGYVASFMTQRSALGRNEFRISLHLNRELHIARISKPGRRLYVKNDAIPKVLNGLGISILSTPRGVMTNKQARSARIGGELLCEVW